MASLTHLDPESLITARPLKQTTIDLIGGILCHICHLTYPDKKNYDQHYSIHETDKSKIIYKCVVCSKEIAGYPSFRGHCYTAHVSKEKYKCEICNKNFSKLTALKEHKIVKHYFKCGACNKDFNTSKELQVHKVMHNQSDTPPYNCQICNNKIDSIEGCHSHIDLHCKNIYTCPVCNENIPDINKALHHLKFHFDEETNDINLDHPNNSDKIEKMGGILCSLCSHAYKNRMEFDAHFSCCHGDEDVVYTCVVCGKQFEKYSVFSQHAYNHVTKGRFECNMCSKTYPRISLLVTHMAHCQNDSGATGKPFVCHKCNHRYATENHLRKHLKVAHNIFQLECLEEGCGKKFKTSSELIFHQRYHSSKEKWCGQCGYLFTSLHMCQSHLDVHRKQLFICPICNRNYSEKNSILNHVNQHFETLLHMCKFCGKVYNAKNRLMEHIKTHSDNKIHSCSYCDKSFARLNHLQQHLNTHTGAKPYKCPICPKSFSSLPNWSKHLHRMHNSSGSEYKKEIMKSVEAKHIIQNNDKSDTNMNKGEVNVNSSEMDICEEKPKLAVNNDLKLETYVFYETDNSAVETDIIDHSVIEKELNLFENNFNKENSIIQNIDVTSTTEDLIQTLEAEIPQIPQTNYPPEYGPEFNIATGSGSGFINLDDHNLPHIDPLLTIKIEQHNQMLYKNMPPNQGNFVPNIEYIDYSVPKWEPPVITKEDTFEANKLMLWNGDHFEVFT